MPKDTEILCKAIKNYKNTKTALVEIATLLELVPLSALETPLELAACLSHEDIVRLILYWIHPSESTNNNDTLSTFAQVQSKISEKYPALKDLISDPHKYNKSCCAQRATEFAYTFLFIFKLKLEAYQNESYGLSTKLPKLYEYAKNTNQAFSSVCGGATNYFVGAPFGRVVERGLSALGDYYLKHKGEKGHLERARKVWSVFRNMHVTDQEGLHKLMTATALDIFQMFEQFFVEMTSSEWAQEGPKMAIEALEHVMSYVAKNGGSVASLGSMVSWFLKGSPKFSMFNTPQLENIIQRGGVVKVLTDPSGESRLKFYRRRKGNGSEHAVDKVGYRVVPDWECVTISSEEYVEHYSKIRNFYGFEFTNCPSIRTDVETVLEKTFKNNDLSKMCLSILTATENMSKMQIEINDRLSNIEMHIMAKDGVDSGKSEVWQTVCKTVEELFGGEHDDKIVLQQGLLLVKFKLQIGHVSACVKHVVSLWEHAIHHDDLIKTFILGTNGAIQEKLTIFFHVLIENGGTDLITKLLEKLDNFKESHKSELNSLANSQRPDGKSPMHIAAWRKHEVMEESVIKLLQWGASVTLQDNDCLIPLHVAAKKGNKKVAEPLLKHDPQTIDAQSPNHFTPLHYALKFGQCSTAEFLIAKATKDCSLTAETEHKFTPMHFACEKGFMSIVQLLFNKLTDPHSQLCSKTLEGFTPLHVAAKRGNLEVINFLLENNVVVDAVTNSQCTPLHQAVRHTKLDTTTVIKALVNAGANVNAQDEKNFAVIHSATIRGFPNIVRYLVTVKGIRLDLTTNLGKSALDLAKSRKNPQPEIAEVLEVAIASQQVETSLIVPD